MIDKKIEILSPAGSFEAVKAAVACGADEIYLGGKHLNARRNAANFDQQELCEVVEYCHGFGVKIHLTVNILVYDKELDIAVEAIKMAAKAGVDALIIQDLAVLKIAKEIAPHIKRHASTQMAVHNLEGVLEAKELGFSRVVLARELTKNEIEYICKNTDVEIEVFLHGALCMCVSGQCYLSSMIGERSGNRGLCAQPCRLPFKNEQGSQHALSLKDLSIVDEIKELERIGVTSVKIEGRMKRPEYVAAATKAAYDARNGNDVDFDTLKEIFSRSGFTGGYFQNKIDYTMFGTRQKEDVVSAAGVLGELAGLYRNAVPRIYVDMNIEIKEGKPVTLTCHDRYGNVAKVYGELPQIAINKPTDLIKAKQNLEKTGGTPFLVGDITGEIDEGLIVPASQLNSLRRDVLENILQQRIKPKEYASKEFNPLDYTKGNKSVVPKIRVRISDISQITDYMLNNADAIIMSPRKLKLYLEQNPNADKTMLWAELNSIDFNTKTTNIYVKELVEQGVTDFVCGNIGGIGILKENNVKNIHGGFGLNIFNATALDEYKQLGLTDTELSFELNLNHIYNMGRPINVGIVAYGYLPLMTFRNCPIKPKEGCGSCKKQNATLKDRMGIEFLVNCEDGESRLFNSVPLYLADRTRELMGLDFITLYFTTETAAECQNITKAYIEGGENKSGITRGLYYRNVQ